MLQDGAAELLQQAAEALAPLEALKLSTTAVTSFSLSAKEGEVELLEDSSS